MRSAAILLCLVLFCDGACARTIESLDYRYYRVIAVPGLSLRESLFRASPIRENGESFLGHTKWNVYARYWWNEAENGTCTMREVVVTLTSTILLPRLDSASPAQRREFDRFIVALDAHEKGHFEHGRGATRALDRALSQMPRMRSCAELEREASRLIRVIIDQYGQKDRDYDAQNNHGRTQGAWLK